MDIYDLVLDVIDLRSFSNLWYWIALAVLWSSASHWVLGVPNDLIHRARRQGGQAESDVETLVQVNMRRILGIARTAAVPLFAFAGFLLTMLVLMGFWYGIEFAQAVFFLVAPMIIVGWLSVFTAAKIESGEDRNPALYRRLMIHRRLVQAVGMVSIFVTSLWGMYQNLNMSILN
ncbi:component of SufBCD complex [Neotabrizicola sp. sgz301269]|uniref:component of SufBCD complex n=1 Tax=Neotabrizicola sp. sgz301269 TaxID=3276282 RepID=UPI0037702135